MVVKLSSKGQMVIPKKIRKQLALENGMSFDIEVVGREIRLRPRYNRQRALAAIEQLRGSMPDVDLISDLEKERQRERLRDESQIEQFCT